MRRNSNIMRRCIFATVISSISTVTVSAQKEGEKVEANVSVDLVSSYIWRGQQLDGVSVQPSLGISYNGLNFGAWGSVGLEDHNATEIDLTASYETGGLSLGITDYWIIGDATYFHYDAHSTNHVFEANIGYDFGPLALSWNTNFAGADYFKDEYSKRAYSSYFQVDVPFKLGALDWMAEAGATPWEGAYADEFAVVNVGIGASKTINISSNYSMTAAAKLIANPHTESMYFVFGISF